MEFLELIQHTMRVRKQYAQLEERRYGRAWTSEEVALGFVGDVGDLAKLVQAQNGVRNIPNAENKIAHELADCLWSTIVLAEMFGIDLERAFVQTMNELEKQIVSRL